LKKELLKFFSPEFLNRIDDTVVFNSLKPEDINKITKIELDRLINRLEKINYHVSYSDELIDFLSEAGFDETYGARPLKRAIQDKIEDYISEEVLNGNMIEGKSYVINVVEKNIKIIERKTKKSKK
jgi:ATP-dependent Clp protease ATP-binding subunit ClpC